MSRQHDIMFAPSGSGRWLNCTASPVIIAHMIESGELSDESSIDAEIGTAVHELSEHCFHMKEPTKKYIGKVFNGIVINEDMAEGGQVYVTYLKRLVKKGYDVKTEGLVNISLPTRDTSGHIDANALKKKEVIVADYKNGVRPVDVIDNTQLQLYAIGVMDKMKWKPKKIKLVIVQPNANHVDGVIREWSVSRQQLESFKRFVGMRQAEALSNSPVFRPSESACLYCPYKPRCPEQKAMVQELARLDFTEPVSSYSPPTVDELTAEQLRKLLEAAPLIKKYLDAAAIHAMDQLKKGKEVDGFKLVRGRLGNRAWKDPVKAEKKLTKALPNAELHETKFKSPTQVEKIIKELDSGVKLDTLVERAAGKPTLVPEDDKREALVYNVADDFEED